MDADAQPQLMAAERWLLADHLHHRERKPAHGCGALDRTAAETGGRHVVVADGLDLVDAISLAQRVAGAYQPVEKVDHLFGREVVSRLGEPHEVSKHHG